MIWCRAGLEKPPTEVQRHSDVPLPGAGTARTSPRSLQPLPAASLCSSCLHPGPPSQVLSKEPQEPAPRKSCSPPPWDAQSGVQHGQDSKSGCPRLPPFGSVCREAVNHGGFSKSKPMPHVPRSPPWLPLGIWCLHPLSLCVQSWVNTSYQTCPPLHTCAHTQL